MIIRNLIIGWRNIRKSGIYSLINIAGLSLGMAVVVLIMYWVVDELSFDKYHSNLDQIYTVYEHQQYSEGQELFTNCTPFPLSNTLVKNFAEVENATTFANIDKQLFKYKDMEFKEGPVICTDNNFLKIFSFKLLEGDSNALSSPEKIIITDEFANLFFGNESAIGKVINLTDDITLTVGAVIASQKANSSLNFKVLASIEVMKTFGVDLSQWGNNWPSTCILLAKGTNSDNLNSKITDICKDNGQSNTSLHLFPYKNEHLYSYSGKSNRIQYIYQFLGIAFIILLIASINFINLSTAKADQRRPEVGIRKVMGAGKSNILRQFLLEKGMMIFLSIILCGLLVILFLPAFRSISDKNIIVSQLQNS
jgi:putative ABC transport system permease protein